MTHGGRGARACLTPKKAGGKEGGRGAPGQWQPQRKQEDATALKQTPAVVLRGFRTARRTTDGGGSAENADRVEGGTK